MKKYLAAVRKAWSSFGKLPNVVGVGLGLKEKDNKRTNKLATVVYVTQKVAKGELATRDIVPKQIKGLETDVVEVGHIKFLQSRTDRLRPAQPGMSIGHLKITAGTFGALVKDAKTNEPLILSNNHILANASNGEDDRASIGDPIMQPGPYDGGGSDDIIGHLLRFIPIASEYLPSTCRVSSGIAALGNAVLMGIRPNYRLQFVKLNESPNLVDCAVAKPISPDVVSPAIVDMGPFQGVAEADFGETLRKSGRTTGLTSGRVIGLAATLRVEMYPGVSALFHDQIVTDLKSRGG